jgi:hypothetical protein
LEPPSPVHPFLRRHSFPPYIRLPALAIAYGVWLPIFKLADKTGQFSRLAQFFYPQVVGRSGHFGDYQPDAHDVLICSHFKSGTNWMMQIALQIAHHGQAEYAHIHDLIPWPDGFDPRYSPPLTDRSHLHRSPTRLRVIKTHLTLDKVPYTPTARYICVVRDPKDVFVSSYHFARSIMFGPLMPSVESWLASYLTPYFLFGDWSKHLHSAWQLRHRENVLFFTYRQIKADLPGAIARVAHLMGVPLTPEQLQTIQHKSSFAYMKTIDHKFYPGAVVPWTPPNGQMMRRGQHGHAHEMLTPAQQQRIDDHFRTQLQQMGCDFPYDESFSPLTS